MVSPPWPRFTQITALSPASNDASGRPISDVSPLRESRRRRRPRTTASPLLDASTHRHAPFGSTRRDARSSWPISGRTTEDPGCSNGHTDLRAGRSRGLRLATDPTRCHPRPGECRRTRPSNEAWRPGPQRPIRPTPHGRDRRRSPPPGRQRGPFRSRWKGPLNWDSRWWRGRDLNPRPSGYEPDELPDCSTPRRAAIDHQQRPNSVTTGKGGQAGVGSWAEAVGWRVVAASSSAGRPWWWTAAWWTRAGGGGLRAGAVVVGELVPILCVDWPARCSRRSASWRAPASGVGPSGHTGPDRRSGRRRRPDRSS